MSQFLADVAGVLEIFAIAAGLVLLHRAAKQAPAALLKTAGWVLVVGGIAVGLSTSYYWFTYQSRGAFAATQVANGPMMRSTGPGMGSGMMGGSGMGMGPGMMHGQGGGMGPGMMGGTGTATGRGMMGGTGAATGRGMMGSAGTGTAPGMMQGSGAAAMPGMTAPSPGNPEKSPERK